MPRSGKQLGTPGRSQHTFAMAPQANIPRSTFNRSHGNKTTFDAGYLVPVYVDEALPGDTFNLRMTAFSRMSTPIFPIMDNLYMDSFFFFVPNRLLWTNWEKFNGAQDNPGDTTDYVIPTATSPVSTGYAVLSLQDHMGIPAGIAGIQHSNLFLRAYNLIYNEWFRDENLQNSVVVDVDDGPDDPADYVLLRRGKRHDYFTSALPWPQKGTAVDLPLGSTAPVVSSGTGVPTFDTATQISNSGLYSVAAGTSAVSWDASSSVNEVASWNTTALEADLSNATAATINQLREAFQIQKLYERDARGGTRYTEIIRSHFGVISPDARLQRPEYLGGGSTPVNISPVAQTSGTGQTGQDTPQGNLAAFATASIHGHGFSKSFTEHGIIIGLVSVRADLNYQQGLNRMWSRSTRFDFYWPALSHIGEQAILNQEIYAQGTAGGSDDTDVFGYQERYAEYRYKPSEVSAAFRSSYVTTLDAWHLAQDFAALPALDSSFIVENPPMDRILAVANEPHFIFDSFFSLKCARPMPVYSVPGLIDHF